MLIPNFHVLRAPAGEGTDNTGADTKIDRGDDFIPTIDEVIEAEEEKSVKADDKVDDKKAADDKKADDKDDKKEKKDNLIPRERFNEAVAKERAKTEAAAARAKEAESRLALKEASVDVADVKKQLRELVKERNSHLSDGLLDKASDVDDKIMELQEALAEKASATRIEAAKEAAKEEIRYDNAVAQLEKDYPQINPDDEAYDVDSVREVRALMRGYQAELGLSPSAALLRAGKRVFGPVKSTTKEDTKADPDAEAKAKEEGMRRKQEAVDKNLDASKRQPASTKETGLDHDKKGGGLDAKSIIKLPYAEFEKIGDEVLSRARGDAL